MLANKALVDDLAFVPSEGDLLWTGGEFLNRRLHNIAEIGFILYVKITAENIPIMLNDDIVSAFGPESTLGLTLSHAIGKHAVKRPYADFSYTVVNPPVENTTHEVAVLFRSNAKIGYLAGIRVPLHTLYELEVSNFMLYKKVPDLIRMLNVFIVEKYEDIELDVVFLTSLDGGHYAVPCSLAGMVLSVEVVVFLRAIQAYAYKELIFSKELAPVIVIEQNSVGLQGICNDLPIGSVLLLKLDDALIKIEPHECRLTTLPGKAAVREMQPDVAGNEFFGYLVAHSVRAFSKNICLA